MSRQEESRGPGEVKVATLCFTLWLNWLSPVRLLYPWNSPGNNTGVGCYFFLQGIFLTQGSDPGLQHYRPILYHLSHQRSPMERYSVLKRNELSSHRETWRKFKCWWLSGRNLSAKGYTLWSQPHDILEKAKLRRQQRGEWWPGTGGRGLSG